MSTQRDSFSATWIAAGFLLIAGGVAVADIITGLIGGSFGPMITRSIVLLGGSFAGGMVAGTASRGRTVLAPALGGVVLLPPLCQRQG